MKSSKYNESLVQSFESFRIANFSWYDHWVYQDGKEILDEYPESSEAAEVIKDLDKISRLVRLNGTLMSFILPYLLQRSQFLGRPLRILEVCCGNGWFARCLSNELSKRNQIASICGTDLSRQTIDLAKSEQTDKTISWQVANVLQLPFEKNKFDLCINLQSLHHFKPNDSVRLLSEMCRVSEAVFLFDIRRTPYGVAAMNLLRPFFSQSFIHDAIVSHRRAFSVKEAHWLAGNASTKLNVCKLTPFGMVIHTPQMREKI